MDWSKPTEVSELEIAFGGNLDILMPRMEEIPAEFHRHAGTKWNDMFSTWFYKGISRSLLVPKDETIDQQMAMEHLAAIMGSWQPKHEHKEAACAYLMSLWFK